MSPEKRHPRFRSYLNKLVTYLFVIILKKKFMSKSICFVGLDSYPVLNPLKGNEYFGGESVQLTLLAKAFSAIGYEVTMLCLDYGQPENEVIDGVRVLKTYHNSDGLPGVRFIYPRMTSVVSALRQADADIYFQSCAGALTGIVAGFCKHNHKKFIFRLAHDSDCIPGEQIIRLWRDRKIYEYGLQRADLISAQGVKQVALLKQHYQLNSIPVNMTVQLPDEVVQSEKNIDILWVNNYRDFKRPELVPDLARLLPEFNIVMIGGPVPGNEELFEDVKKQADDVDNLSVMGAISYQDVNAFFERSKIFVNTSDWEGFPNSFLQAWIRGVPVVSFFDPDDLIVNMNMGAVPDGLEDMARKIREILEDDVMRKDIADQSRKYVLDNYSPVAVAHRYENLIYSCDEKK